MLRRLGLRSRFGEVGSGYAQARNAEGAERENRNGRNERNEIRVKCSGMRFITPCLCDSVVNNSRLTDSGLATHGLFLRKPLLQPGH